MSREQRVQFMVKDAPVLYQGVMKRAFDGEASPRQAIKAQCLACTGYSRQAVADCTGFSCPLWSYRPYQNGDNAQEE